MTDTFTIDGVRYCTEELSDEGRSIWRKLLFARRKLNNLHNQTALLSKAKNGYIGDIKTDVVRDKSGVDLATLFTVD